MRASGPGLALYFLVLFRPCIAVPAAEGLLAFPDSLLERYYQWGLYDSLALGVESRLSPGLPARDSALLHDYRGVAWLSQHRDAEAASEFRLSACQDSARFLDPYYLAAEMQTAYQSSRAAALSGNAGCFAKPEPVATATPPAPPLPPRKSNLPSGRTLGLAGSFGAAAVLAAWAGWEFYQASDTYAVMERAAHSGDTAAYRRNQPAWNRDFRDHRRNTWVAGGAALACAALGTGVGLLVKKPELHVSLRPEPSVSVAWSF